MRTRVDHPAVAVNPTVEILITPNTSQRGQIMLHALERQYACTITRRYEGQCDWLMLFGAGGDDRLPAWQQHRDSGRRTVVWDLGYWNREDMLRVSVDDLHPHRFIYAAPLIKGRGYPRPVRDDYCATGPVIFARMGRKSLAQHGDWDKRKIRELGDGIIIRDKPDRLSKARLGHIEDALRGASRLVCHHSNSAIDAIIAGVPHDCVDGAAFALKPTRDPALRREFLDRLGAWQWAPGEAGKCWEFLRSVPNA